MVRKLTALFVSVCAVATLVAHSDASMLFGRRLGFLGNDSYTKLLLHFDGSDGAKSAEDVSASKHTITFNGDAELDDAQKKYGTTSLWIPTSLDYVYTNTGLSDFYFSTGNFTIDFWIRFRSLPSSGAYQNLMGQYKDSSNYWHIRVQESSGTYNLQMLFFHLGSPKGDYVKTGLSLSTDTWYHLAFVRSGSTGYIFLNGADQSATASTAFGTSDVGDINEEFVIGWTGITNYPDIWIDELRISKGIARWTANFTPMGPYR